MTCEFGQVNNLSTHLMTRESGERTWIKEEKSNIWEMHSSANYSNEGFKEVRISSHLCLWNDRPFSWLGTEERRKWGGHHHRIRPHKATEVTAWDGVLLCLQHQSVHGVENIPREPHGALLTQKWSPFESECERGSTVGNEVKSNDTDREEGGKTNRVLKNQICTCVILGYW